MPLSSGPSARRRADAGILVRVLFALFALLALPPLAAAWDTTMDPVFVFYPRDLCDDGWIGLEVWDRAQLNWIEHPGHPVIPANSCQLEDAGVLLNEIRWRCLASDRAAPEDSWKVGVRVFESSVMAHCGVARTGGGFGATEIHVSNPKPGETISDADGNAEIEGSVWIGGLAGAQYDVVIAIDTSAAESGDQHETALEKAPSARAPAQPSPSDPLAAQVRAAREFVDAIRDRLGDVRVGIVSFPGLEESAASGAVAPGGAGSTGESREPLARRELPLSDDHAAIQRALDRVIGRKRAGPMSFTDGLSLAVDELFRPPDWPGAARPGARRIVMLSADGSGGFPFGPSAQADRDFRERNVERARSASQRGVALHLFALGGISEKPPAFIDAMLANRASSFTRVTSPERAGFFADRVSMPYLEALSIHDAATEQLTGFLSFTSDGRFAASVPLAPGENQLIVRAQTSDGDVREDSLTLNFDASAYRDRLLDDEAARIQRARKKHIVLEVLD